MAECIVTRRGGGESKIYTESDCRFANYSIYFPPGITWGKILSFSLMATSSDNYAAWHVKTADGRLMYCNIYSSLATIQDDATSIELGSGIYQLAQKLSCSIVV